MVATAPTLPKTVEVPTDLLLEALGYLDALDIIGGQLAVAGFGDPMNDDGPMEYLVKLVDHIAHVGDLEDDEYDAHPANIAIKARSAVAVAAFEANTYYRVATFV